MPQTGRTSDGLERVEGATDLKESTTAFDGAGRVAAQTDWTPQWSTPRTRTYAYASDGTVTTAETRRAGDAALRFSTDGTGLLRSIAGTLSGAPVDWSVTETDTAGRVVNAMSTAFPVDYRVRYDEAGRVVWAGGGNTPPQAVLPNGWMGSGTAGEVAVHSLHIAAYVPRTSGALATYVYDTTTGKKRHDSFGLQFGSRAEETTYTYGISDRLVSAVTNGAGTTYAYDPASGALSAYRRPGESTATLSYDAAGHLTAVGSLVYHSDSLGRRVSTGPSSNPSQTVLAWNADRLSTITSASLSATYTYDGTGQRVGKAVRAGSAATSTAFDYDGTRLLGLTRTGSAGASASVDYVYDERGTVFAGVYHSGTATATPFILETTDRGDVRELLDSSGAAFALYSYDPYGRPTETTTTATARVPAATAAAIAAAQPLRYAGYVYDSESGYYYCSARYYDPNVGAFISKDPAKADGEESAYQYCAGEPVGARDETGRAYAKFNGNRFRVYRFLPSGKYRQVINARAYTGVGLETDPDGPIPHGTYTIYYSGWRYTRFRPGNWGPWRSRLHWSSDTNVHGRVGFFLHSYDPDTKVYQNWNPPNPLNGLRSGWGPTHGCIRVDPSKMRKIRRELRRDSNRQMPIYVSYPGGNTC